MRWNQISLTESLIGQSVPYQWTEQSARAHVAQFAIGDLGFWVKAYLTRGRLPPHDELHEMWVLNFGIDPHASERLHGHKHAIMKPTGLRQNTAAIMSTVQAALDEFIRTQQPDMIWMSDTDDQRGRARLYSRYAQHIIGTFGYHYNTAIMQHFAGQHIWVLQREAELAESGLLPHTEQDDGALEQQMQALSARKTDLHELGHIGHLAVASTHWPPQFRSHFFFRAKDALIGFAILQQGGRAKQGEQFAITMIYLRPAYRKQGFATAFYRFLMDKGVALQPDTKQSAGGAAVWRKLNQEG